MLVKILAALCVILFFGNVWLVLAIQEKTDECGRLLGLYKGKTEECAALEERAEGLAENARQCLAREAKAIVAAAERSAIMEKAMPRERTEAEKEKVVDDETRKRVAGRLNRPL